MAATWSPSSIRPIVSPRPRLRSGAWPLWDPALYVGAPHVADIQAGFLYPPNLMLFWLWPDFPYAAMQWLSLAHLWFAGAGTYLLLARGLKLRRLAALAGALAFMFSDSLIIHFGNLNFNAVASWTPWVFWAFLSGMPDGSASGQGLGRPRFARGALAGVLLGLATLAGHPQVTLFILLALACYAAAALYLAREDAGPGRRALLTVAYLALAGLLTGLLAAPVLLPALQLTGYTTRAAWNYQEAAGYSVSPAQWIGWLVPGFFGRAPQFHWGAWPRVEVGYLGILPLVLAGVGAGSAAGAAAPGPGPRWRWPALCWGWAPMPCHTAGSRCCLASASCAHRRGWSS